MTRLMDRLREVKRGAVGRGGLTARLNTLAPKDEAQS